MKSIDIGCPAHGYLYSNTVFAKFKTDTQESVSVPCQFCFRCKCFYTASPDFKRLKEPTVKGSPLLMGRAYSEPNKNTSKAINAQTASNIPVLIDDEFENTIIPLGEKSILGKRGYSTNLGDAERHWILEGCVDKYGKSAVIEAIQRNISLRKKQQKDYSYAIGIWSRDIEYVKTLDDHVFQEWLASEMERLRKEREKYFEEQNVFWWEKKD